MNIGIFGGTFNPIHYGHLINVELVRSETGLDRVILVPTKQPVHKELEGNASAEDRYAMACLAVAQVPGYEVSRLEIDREEPSYTIITVEALMARYPEADLHLIIGMDSLNDIHTWREADRLVKMVSLIVMRRPGAEVHTDMVPEGARVRFIENPLIDIHGSEIRERLARGLSVRFQIPDMVLDYIHQRGLYLT